ncbi:hypothetical protein VNO78_33743 [Psophocarpus tetragonolobus]|uniref:25S rRNA (uridine-N(3))-methyltransferase BMT5-like domain-containing protein n=1 Tax=Psophocarpus tetragonolobus TaxID=3891 RepID=A0AAN9RQX1_PSOTE
MEEKSITHYRSSHQILLVGEGDFSFSLCLARAFGTAKNMVATSLDSRESLMMKYGDALRNLTELESLGCTILHEVDVHTMAQHYFLCTMKFDRVIFNFPHAGFVGRESDTHQIALHKHLVGGFFSNAKFLLSSLGGGGEIHITHKTTHPYTMWDIKNLANSEDLVLVGEEGFSQYLYPGYNNKRGAGVLCDQSFRLGACSTFKFRNGSIIPPCLFEFI